MMILTGFDHLLIGSAPSAVSIYDDAVTEIEFRVPRNCDLRQARRVIEDVCKERGLHTAMKGSLAAYPRCTHWHFKKLRQSGTLELTLYIPERRIWAQVQDGRRAEWIEEELPLVRRAIENKLRKT